MAAASSPTTSGIKQNQTKNYQDDKSRPPTVEELLIQIENHLYNSIEHRASLLIAAWTCLGGQIGYFRCIEKVFNMMYRESALMIFSRHWPKVDILFKRGLSRSLIQYSHTMGSYVKGSEGLCSALVMATYDPWGDPVMHQLLNKQDVDFDKVKDFVKSEPYELLLIRVECLVNSRCEEAAIRLCRSCLHCYETLNNKTDIECDRENWKLSFMEWLLRLLFRKRRLNDLVQEISSCNCHEGVRIIYRTLNSNSEDSEALTESLINLFLVRDLLFQSNYCCTSELMNLWCELQAKKQKPLLEIQEAARKLLVGHASSSAQFYLFVDILWSKFGISLLPLYLELYVRGLTSDLNFLEAARQTDKKEYVIELENHMAAMYFKLSSLFNSISKEVSLECLLSSFSLNPSRKVLECIKKTTLQVTKERAIRSSRNPADIKHSRNSAFPTLTKRKDVVTRDQAIQVGDDFFVECDNALKVANNPTQNDPIALENIRHERKKLATEITVLSPSIKSKNSEEVLASQSQLPNNTTESNSVLENSPAVTKEKTPIKIFENKKHTLKSARKSKICSIQNEVTSKENSNENISGSENAPTNCNERTSETTAKCEIERDCHKVTENQDVISSVQPLSLVNHSTNEHLTNGLSNESDVINCKEEVKCSSPDKEKLQNSSPKDIEVVENKVQLKTNINGEQENEKPNSHQEKISNDTHCINGFNEPVTPSINNDAKITNCKELNLINDSVNQEPDQNLIPNKSDGADGLNPPYNSQIAVINNLVQKTANNSINENRVTRRSELLKSQSSVLSFSHVILDCNVPGLSSDLLSDFVTVLESLRNKQLKSSSKWSQIKHLCEDYMETVNEQRCMMFNFQANGSVDSEADSTSELTANGFDFEHYQSDDSVKEDRAVDKSHVFRRFFNSDKMAEMATYVTLSDIHCPQIPLEKLFYTEYSSSHVGHKKRHKKHRNHDKNPKKQVLHKLRHGSRTEHDLVKRKKRKKRKTKRGKGHVKKHHSTHGKVNKIHSKNKRKKHKLKKKKEGNSGFISGDYCSDFSSEELMRIVKEHSNSYSKIPASTSKHPHIVETASSSESEPVRKKRKVSFDKKRAKVEKYREKHKHEKSNKHKKKITLESCKTSVTNVIHDNPIPNNMEGVKEYPHFVQISRVKKMESVQIQQRSVSVVDDSTNDTSPITTCDTNPRIKQYVQQKFENCSPEELMKMQILMARQQAEVTAGNSTMSTNQALRKYVCSKMTSQLLSVSQSSKCIVGSDSDTSKSPTPHFVDNNSKAGPSQSRDHPQKISANIKHFVIETNKTPYKFPNSNVSTTVSSSIIPLNISGNSYSDAQNLIGSMLNSNIRCPTSQIPPQVTALSIPVSHNHPSGSKLVTSKIIIPLPSSGQLHSGTVSSNLSVIQPDTSFASTSGTSSHSSFIVIKNGNQTQIIPNPQNQYNIIPHIAKANASLTTTTKISPTVCQTNLKMIKPAVPKKSFQSVAKRQLIKNPAPIKPLTAPKVSSVAKPIPKVIALTAPSSSVVTTKVSDAVISSVSLPDAEIQNSLKVPIPLPLPSLSTKAIEEKPETEIPPHSESNKTDCGILKLDIHVPASSDTASSSKPNEVALVPETSNSIVSEQVEKTKQIISEEKQVTENNTGLDLLTVAEEPSITNSFPPDVQKQNSIEDTEKNSVPSQVKSVSDKSDEALKEEERFIDKDIKISSKADIKNEELSVKSDDIDVSKTIPLHTEAATVATDNNAEIKSADSNAECSLVRDFKSSENKSLPVAEPVSPKPSPVTVDQEALVEHSPDSKESNSSSKSVLNQNNQQKQLQPINSVSIMASMKTPGKAHSQCKAEGMVVSEVQTRSFTSISDAVRFSLMDMDDATDSVENQVLQAFQVTHETSQSSPPRYENSSTNDGNEQPASPSAVILTTPQSSTTTDLNVSQVSQRFEASVHSSQTEKFVDCQGAVSRTTSWILEDSAINDTSQNINLQKSPDIDSSCEGKEEEKPKKKKKRKDRCDPEAAHKFWCEICHKGFFSAYNLRRHCRNVHKMALPKGTSDLPFGPNSHAHQHMQQGESSSSEIASPPRLPYGSSQSSCVSPKGPDYMLQSPTRDTKTHEFAAKVVATSQHSSPMQTDFQLQTAARITGQSTSSHISPTAAAKSVQSDFQLPTPTTVSSSHITSNKMPSATKTAGAPKFQRLPTSCSTAAVSQISVCGQQSTLQQQRQLSQIQSSGLIQPVPSVACQAQQLQAAQCPHFQTKQIAQQRIGQLQLMHHATQIPALQHTAHGIQKQTPVQQYKKCGASLQSSKMTETEQIQQNAQLAQTQQILANQQMQKIMQIRQNAIAASGVATQLSLGTGVPGAQSSNVKAAAAAQCFQSQLAVARQAAAVAQLSVTQRGQTASFALASHDSTGHQFFTPSIQPSPEQSSCTHASFTAQNLVEYSANAPSYPTIRLSSEANDGLEDLEQFLMENMPWSSDQSASHGMSQQSGNRPSSADSLTLSIPTPVSSQGKSKTPISRPKPRKPVVASCSKNLLGNLSRGVKKKSTPKKAQKHVEINCPTSKAAIFTQNCVKNQQSHGLDLIQMHCDKGTSSDVKQVCKTTNINETDSSDSVQCINVGHHTPSKNVSVGINFNTFVPTSSGIITDKSITPSYSVDLANSRLFGVQSKTPFLEHGNLVNKNSPNLCQNKSVINPCEINPSNSGYSHVEKGSSFNPAANFCPSVCTSIVTKRAETGQDIFLGQRNSEIGESSSCAEKQNSVSSEINVINPHCFEKTENNLMKDQNHSTIVQADPFLGGRTGDTKHSVNKNDDNADCVTTFKQTSTVNVTDFANNFKQNSDNLKDKAENKNNNTEVISEVKDNISQISDNNLDPYENAEDKSPENFSITLENRNLDTGKEIKSKLLSYENLITTTPETSIINSTINTEQMQELGLKEAIGLNNKPILKEKIYPLECGEFNVSKNLNSAKQSFNGFSVSRILDNESSPDLVSNVCAKKIDNKENLSLSLPTAALDHTKAVYKNCDKSILLPKFEDSEKDSSQEKMSVKGDKFPSEIHNVNVESIEKSAKQNGKTNSKLQDRIDSEESESTKQNKAETVIIKSKKTKDLLKKNTPDENLTISVDEEDQNENCDLKLDINSNIEKVLIKDKNLNGTICTAGDFYQKEDKIIQKDTQNEDSNSSDTKHDDATISSSRLRLRDTPKTSVKRVCPCCVDSRVPKKCRVSKVHINTIKNKSTLKTRNSSSIQNSKVNTRSSQRLRSRHNAVS